MRIPLLSLPFAFLLWYFSFSTEIFSFWFRISISTFFLFIFSFVSGSKRFKPRMVDTFYGLVSGLLLYLLFFSGYRLLSSSSSFLSNVTSVYYLGSGTPGLTIFILLLFPISVGEEFYWRGTIQKELETIVGPYSVLAASSIYSFIHVFTLNLPLMFVAFVGGIVWGYLYRMTSNLYTSFLSHVIFNELIFVIFPFTR
jgi:membrane protease YdiL (CAAX protease family)